MAAYHHNPFPFGTDEGGPTSDQPTYAIEEAPTEELGLASDRGPKGYVGLSVNPRRLTLALVAVASLLMLIVARAAHVQVVQGDVYRDKAEGNRSRIEYIAAERGIIYDRNGIPVVRNTPTFRLIVVPSDLPSDEHDRRHVLIRLAEILDTQPLEIEEELDKATYRGAAVLLAENLTHEQAVLLKIEAASWPAISVENGMRRQYLLAEEAGSLSHVLGYRGRITENELVAYADDDYLPTDLIGKTGLELTYERYLRGTYGRRRIETDASGREKTVIAEERPVNGKGIVMSIDVETQRMAEKILSDQMQRFGKRRGSVIVMKPDTGEVLALVNAPDYDNNLFARGITQTEFSALSDDPDHPMFPRAIAASLPSGSTFKLAVAAAALDEGLVTPKTTYLSVGGLTVNDQWYFPDWKAGGHGYTNLAKAIAESVNTYFYIIGGGYEDIEGLGVARIKTYAERFGFGSRLGIDLPSENNGLIPDPAWKEAVKGERWYIGDTYHLAIGQGDILVTPLQIAAMTGVFANGGKLMQPRIVNAITSDDGTRTVIDPKVLNPQVVSSDAIAAVRNGMRETVRSGSAQSFAALPVTVAAKTGTAEWSSTKPPHAWFTSFAPYEDPEIVVTVLIEEGEEGSRVAAPVAREIYRWYFSRTNRP